MPRRISRITRRSSTAAQTFLSKFSATVDGTPAAPSEWVRCPSTLPSKLRRLSRLRKHGLEQRTRLKQVVNLKAAKALELTIPQFLLVTTDRRLMTLKEYLTPDPSLRAPQPCLEFIPDTLPSMSSRPISPHSAISVHGWDFFDGRKVRYEAELELNFALLAKMRPDVTEVAEQP